MQTSAASPAVRGAQRGLEMWWWVVTDERRIDSPPARRDEEKQGEREGEDHADSSNDNGNGDGNGSGNRDANRDGKPDDEPEEEPEPWFVLVDHRLSIEQALAPYADRPVPVPDDVRLRWQASGLRIVAVPIADLDRIEQSIRLIGPRQRQWLGELPDWTYLVRGPALGQSRRAMLDSGDTLLEPGRLRLLGRAWIVPDYAAGEPGPQGRRESADVAASILDLELGLDDRVAGAGRGTDGADFGPRAALRVELVPQHEPQLTEAQRLLAVRRMSHPSALRQADQDGRLFLRLALGATLSGEDALVIVPDSPQADWSALLADSDDAGSRRRTRRGQEDDADHPPRIASLGEQMLAVPERENSPRARAVLVLVPRVPDRFELLR